MAKQTLTLVLAPALLLTALSIFWTYSTSGVGAGIALGIGGGSALGGGGGGALGKLGSCDPAGAGAIASGLFL